MREFRINKKKVGTPPTKILSRAINFGRQCHFKIWLDCHKFKKFPCPIMPTSTKCQKIEKKMTINVVQHDDRLWYLRLFYNGAFSIASKIDLDDQNLLLAIVHWSEDALFEVCFLQIQAEKFSVYFYLWCR
jgi:hypothetical protein